MSIIERALEKLGNRNYAKSLHVEPEAEGSAHSLGVEEISLIEEPRPQEINPEEAKSNKPKSKKPKQKRFAEQKVQELPITNKKADAEKVLHESSTSEEQVPVEKDQRDGAEVKVENVSYSNSSAENAESELPQNDLETTAKEAVAKNIEVPPQQQSNVGFSVSTNENQKGYSERHNRYTSATTQSLFYGKKKQKKVFANLFSFRKKDGRTRDVLADKPAVEKKSEKIRMPLQTDTEHKVEQQNDGDGGNIANPMITPQGSEKAVEVKQTLKTQTNKMIRPADKNIVEIDESHSSANRLIWGGFFILLLGFGGLGTWAALAPLKSAAVAPGVVKVAGERKTVQHLEGGIIKDILVEEGDHVEQGQVLIRLDDTQSRAAAQLFEGQYDALVAKAARLLAERDGAEEITFPEGLLSRADDPQIKSLLAGEQKLFETQHEAITGQINVLKQRIKEYKNEIVGLQAQESSAKKQLATIQEELDSAKAIYEQGIYDKPRYLALQRGSARLEGEIGEHAATIAQTKQKIGETELQIIDSKNQQLHKVSQELQSVQTKTFDLEERLNAATDRLTRIEVNAPSAGTIVAMRFHTVGGVIPQGATILDIVPSDGNLIIEVKINPQDIDVVHAGLQAQVQLTAYSMRNTPTLPGEVVYVSADRFTSQQNGRSYYLARIQIAQEALAEFPHITLQPGMPANVQIVIGERTALEYLIKPLKDSLNNAFLEE